MSSGRNLPAGEVSKACKARLTEIMKVRKERDDKLFERWRFGWSIFRLGRYERTREDALEIGRLCEKNIWGYGWHAEDVCDRIIPLADALPGDSMMNIDSKDFVAFDDFYGAKNA